MLGYDYRDVTGSFDRIVSIEMVEAVGEAFWPDYFQVLHDRLRPGGTVVLQAITIELSRTKPINGLVARPFALAIRNAVLPQSDRESKHRHRDDGPCGIPGSQQ